MDKHDQGTFKMKTLFPIFKKEQGRPLFDNMHHCKTIRCYSFLSEESQALLFCFSL